MNPPVVPDHSLIRPIGRGAYGEVWLARNVMGAWRAVKIIWRRQFESQRPFDREFAGIQRFEPVSRSSGGLVHVLHVGRNETEGYFYYVMELADPLVSNPSSVISDQSVTDQAPLITDSLITDYSPRTLRSDLKRRGRLPPADSLRLAVDVVSGLAQLHRHGLVHRDVKPGNIIYVHGRAKLADIGLVSAGGEGRTFVGTEGYIPPEGPGSSGADIYALGIALYEASTGNPPESFPDVPPEWFADDASGEALEFHEIILKACEAQRERRYESAEAMQADLALLQSGQSVRRVRALERRYARLRASGIVGTLLLVCALAIAFVANYRARLATESREKEARLLGRTQAALARAENAEQESRQQLYTALLGEAQATVRSAELGQRNRVLEAVRRASTITNSAALRGAAMAALALPDLRFERDYPTTPDMTLISLDPAFERIALCRGTGPVEIHSLADQQLLATLPPSTNLPAYVGMWSPDGRFFALNRDHDSRGQIKDVEVWDILQSKRLLLLPGCPSGVESFHPRLARIMIAEAPASAVVWDLETLQEVARYNLAGRPVALKFSPDGERFAARHALSNLWAVTVYSTTNGIPLASHSFEDDAPDLDWHPGGGWLALPERSGIYSMDAQTGESRLLGRHKAQAMVTSFTPGGRFLFSGGWDRQLICWDSMDLRRAFTIDLDSYRVQFRKDGRECAIQRVPDVRLQLHAFDWQTPCREFAEDLGGGVCDGVFSRDGRWLAAAGDERVVVWDLSQSGPGTTSEGQGVSGNPVGFSPDGELFALRFNTCFRWRVQPGAKGAAPNLEPLALAKPTGLSSLCLLSNRVVFTGTHGSTLKPYSELAEDVGQWTKTFDGRNGASLDEQWLGIFRGYGTQLEIHRLPDLEREATLTVGVAIARFEFSPLRDEVSVSTRQRVELWSTATWQRTRRLTNFSDLRYAPDARTYWLSSGLRTGGLYDARTLQPILPLPPGTLPMALSPDGRQLAVCVEAHRVQVWDLHEVRSRLRELGLDWEQ